MKFLYTSCAETGPPFGELASDT